jgi:hypothetical protein
MRRADHSIISDLPDVPNRVCSKNFNNEAA